MCEMGVSSRSLHPSTLYVLVLPQICLKVLVPYPTSRGVAGSSGTKHLLGAITGKFSVLYALGPLAGWVRGNGGMSSEVGQSCV